MKRFPFFLAFLVFIVCVYPEGSMIEWSQMTFNLAQLAARPGIILKTERSSLWPQIQNYSTFSSTLCCATPVHRCPSGCWAYQGEPELRHSNWSAVPGNLSVLMAGHLHCTGRFAVLVELLWLWSWWREPGIALQWFFSSAPLVQAGPRQATSPATLMQ